MSNNKVFQGDVGTILEFHIDGDITSAEYAEIKVKKPINTSVWKEGIIIDPNNKVITYKTKDNDLDEAGKYLIQIYIELEDWKGSSDPVELYVGRKL